MLVFFSFIFSLTWGEEGPIAPIKNKSVYNLDMKIQGIAYGEKQIGIY